MLGDPVVLDRVHPLVAGWFRDRFGAPTLPQADGWPHIANGDDVLIAAPTGSGKTLAAFLACIDELIRRGLSMHGATDLAGDIATPLPDQIQILYISPLKALSNDVQRNLEGPLAEITARAKSEAIRMPEIRVAVRTGDTSPAERQKLAKKPPHILVTTPESLYILLTTDRGRSALSSVRTVIVDEIHAIAGDKRGAHLALSMERLDRLVTQTGARAPTRVGLSATQKPLERIARLLGGTARPLPHIIDSGHRRDIDIAIEITDDELGAVASLEQLGRVYDRIATLVREHKTTLVFVNTRRMVERVAAALEERLGEDQVVAHHGSMSRALRFAAEERLKHGQVKCAVATASLELGIDVGAVDLVVQLGSPRAISTLLQRIGRSGHHLGGTPKGRLFALTRDQLIECASLVRGVGRGNLDEIFLRDAPLDVLSQQIVAMSACEELHEADLLALVRRAAQYENLDEHRFEQVLHMLSEGVSDRRARLAAHIHRDRTTATLRGRRGARLAAIVNGGAIPDNANYTVVQWPEEVRVGEVDEDFAIDSSAGDIFQLGNTAWRIRRIEAGRVLVEDAHGQPPTIPFWFGEAPARTRELSDEVSDLRREIDNRITSGTDGDDIAAWLVEECHVARNAAAQVVAYLAHGRASLGALPRNDVLIAERFFDEGGGMQLVIHAPLGGRINRAWGLALRKRFCRSFDFELQAAATDDGIVISLGQPHSFALETVFGFLPSALSEAVLVQALLDAPMFEVRWRWNSTRSLAVLRRFAGKKVAPHLVRMRAADLLSVVFPQAQACLENIPGDREIPDHPLVFETVRDCLVEAMDGEGLRQLMGKLERGEVRIIAKDSVEPSVLCHELINANPYAFLDDAPLEERRTRAVSLRRGLGGDVSAATHASGALSPEAIAAAAAESATTVRDADELHDALLALWLVPDAHAKALHGDAPRWLEQLAAVGRATQLTWTLDDASGSVRNYAAWCAIERLPSLRVLLASAKLNVTATPPLENPSWAAPAGEPEAIANSVIAGHLDQRGPVTAPGLAAELGLPTITVLSAMLALEADGAVLRGTFTAGASTAPITVGQALAASDDGATLARVEWCNRRILARIHRLTLARLRAEIEPVSAAALMRFLLRWQRIAPNRQLIGVDGLARIIEQLQGFETAAGSWEREVLPSRLLGYDQSWLDQLCLGGQVSWCRMSPRWRGGESPDDLSERMAPSRAAPLALLLRSNAAWLRADTVVHDTPNPRTAANVVDAHAAPTDLSDPAMRVWHVLDRHGASFLADLVDRSDLTAELIEDALWELVAAGLATADGFASLRVLVGRKRGETKSHFDLANKHAIDTATPPPKKWLDAVKHARTKDRQRPSHALTSLPTAGGRWSLLPPARPEARDVDSWAKLLLARYGVVFRDLLVRESNLPPWRELLIALRRLEARGEIRGGRFVAGFVGEQYALPDAADELRALRTSAGPGEAAECVRVPATDPLNLVGVLSPGPKVAAVLGNAILYRDGVPIASIEAAQLVIRTPLPTGARVGDDLIFHPPPAPPREELSAQIGFAL